MLKLRPTGLALSPGLAASLKTCWYSCDSLHDSLVTAYLKTCWYSVPSLEVEMRVWGSLPQAMSVVTSLCCVNAAKGTNGLLMSQTLTAKSIQSAVTA